MKKCYDLWLMLKIPLKNIWRNRRRTFFTMAGISFATLCLVLFGGYIRVIEIALRDSAIHKDYGHFQIARTGYFKADSMAPEYLLSRETFQPLLRMLYGLPEVDFVNLRLHLAGIIGNYEKSTVFVGICGQPEAEIMMSPEIIQGEPLSASDPYGIVIGEGLAKKLNAGINSNLLLFFASESGSQEAINVTVRGIFKGLFAEQSNMMVYLPLKGAWELMLEQKVHRVLVFLKDETGLLPVMQRVKHFIRTKRLQLEVEPWEKLAVYYQQIIAMFQGFLLVGGIIIGLIIIFNISNTMYMVINERSREIGTMRAMGNSRGEIIRLLFSEGLIMGIIGVLIGTTAAIILTPAINSLHFTLPPGPGQQDPITIQIMTDWQVIAMVVCGIIIVTISASVLPSIKATRTKIVNLLHQL